MSYQREFGNRIRVAVVGIGSHAYRNILPTLHFLPVELVAVCNHSNKELAELTAREYGCRSYQDTAEMYEKEKPDAALFCVSAGQHPRLMMEAMKRGIHVWAEKPLAMRASELEEMIACRDACVTPAGGHPVALAGYKKAFMPAVRKAREIASSEKYGHLESILAVYPLKIPANGEEVLEQRTMTDWLNNGCHPLSVMMAVGGHVDSVQAVLNDAGHGSAVLFFKNGAVGNLHLASGPQPNEDYHFYAPTWHLQIANTSKVILERGIPSVYGRTTSFVPEGDDTGAVVWEAPNCKATLENMSFFIQGIYDELMEFCNCILEQRVPDLCSLEFALELTKVYEALMTSHGEKKMIR